MAGPETEDKDRAQMGWVYGSGENLLTAGLQLRGQANRSWIAHPGDNNTSDFRGNKETLKV